MAWNVTVINKLKTKLKLLYLKLNLLLNMVPLRGAEMLQHIVNLKSEFDKGSFNKYLYNNFENNAFNMHIIQNLNFETNLPAVACIYAPFSTTCSCLNLTYTYVYKNMFRIWSHVIKSAFRQTIIYIICLSIHTHTHTHTYS